MRQLLLEGISVKVKFLTRFFLVFATFLLSYNAFAFDSGGLPAISVAELPYLGIMRRFCRSKSVGIIANTL
jgi:hypothetical protein